MTGNAYHIMWAKAKEAWNKRGRTFAGRNHIRVCGMEIGMLIIEGNSVYEIDEECVRKKKSPRKCQTAQKLQMQRKRDAESGVAKKSER